MITKTMMMLGARGVGKTSLLATMYKELLRLNKQANFEFMADDDTGDLLNIAYNNLRKIMEQPPSTKLEPLLPTNPAGVTQYDFEVFFNRQKEMDLLFYDHAGALVGNNKATDHAEFREKLNKSEVIINVVDGSALVEGSEMFCNAVNCPMSVAKYLKEALDDEQKHLVLFVITKCETWLRNDEGRRTLLKRFEERHAEVINIVDNKMRRNVVGVVIPVETLHCVEVKKFVDDPKDVEKAYIEFVKRPNLLFEPKGIEQPLRYALAFLLARRYEERDWPEKIVDWWTKRNVAFWNGLQSFANNREKSFKVYGNPALLS